MTLHKYRVVTDKYAGYEAQEWHWYWPFWSQIGVTNTSPTIDQAISIIQNKQKRKVVWTSYDPNLETTKPKEA